MHVVFVLSPRSWGIAIRDYGGKSAKFFGIGVTILKSATVTKQAGKPAWWNEVNPASGQPKFGRGAFI